jgi:hypothetical protein
MVTGALAFGGASAFIGSNCLMAWEIAGMLYMLMFDYWVVYWFHWYIQERMYLLLTFCCFFVIIYFMTMVWSIGVGENMF